MEDLNEGNQLKENFENVKREGKTKDRNQTLTFDHSDLITLSQLFVSNYLVSTSSSSVIPSF